MSQIEKAIAAGSKPERAELIESWIVDHGAPPPKGLSTRLLTLSAAYNAQSHEQGGLRPPTKKRLLASAKHRDGEKQASPVQRKDNTLKPGTRLVREWQGKSHTVDVHDGHVIYGGHSYKSLSAVARTITGARWSGPRFFGVA